MKHFLVSLFTFFFFSGLVAAQGANDYFVVVETNIYEQDHSVVKIYDEMDKLGYEEFIKDIYIDISREKHRKLILNVNKWFSFFMKEKLTKNQYQGFIGTIIQSKV